MPVNIAVKEGSVATVNGPARAQVIAAHGAVKIDGAAVDSPRFQVDAGKAADITGPATVRVISDVPGSVLIDGEPVIKPPPSPDVAPVVTSLSPNEAVAGDPTDIVMSVIGTGFGEGSIIVFNGWDEPTTLVSPTEVTTGVKPSLFVVPADCPVGVRNGSAMSNEEIFSFTE